MDGKFVIGREVTAETPDWGELRYLSNPPSTGARQLTIIDVRLSPGKGHNFHKHPDQEEVIYIVAGEVEQWVDREARVLNAGDSAFVPAGVVHASFNVGDGDAQIVAILGPCVGDTGYVSVEMGEEAPWDTLRAR